MLQKLSNENKSMLKIKALNFPIPQMYLKFIGNKVELSHRHFVSNGRFLEIYSLK